MKLIAVKSQYILQTIVVNTFCKPVDISITTPMLHVHCQKSYLYQKAI